MSDQGEKKEAADEAAHWLVRMHSGEATAADRENMARWRARDPRNDEEYRKAERLWEVSRNLKADRKTGKVRPSRKTRNTLKPLILILGIGIAGFFTWRTFEPAHDFETATSETRTVTLSDGTRATLDARSAIDVAYTAGTRVVSVSKGQVFFEVARDPKRPFEVSVFNTTVTALGTAFNVNARGPNSAVEIAVTDHAVRVVVGESRRAEESSIIKANEMIVSRAGKLGPVQAVDRDSVVAWRKGLLIAEGRTLSEVIAELRPHHPGWIVMAGDAAARMEVNAVLKLTEPVESLKALSGGLPIRIVQISPFLTVVSER